MDTKRPEGSPEPDAVAGARLRYRWEHTWDTKGADFSIVLDGHYVARIRKTLRHMPIREVWSWGTFPFSINGHGFGPSGLENTKMDAARAAEAAIDKLLAEAQSFPVDM